MNLPRVLDSNLHEVRRLHPISLAVNNNLTPLSDATMVVRKGELVDGRTFVRLYTPNGVSEIYRTRVPETAPGEEAATIQLEHAVCEIGDYVVQDAINAEYTVRNAFVELFSHYRGSKWQLGSFSASETVVIDCDYDNVLEMMLSILEQATQYMMTFDFSTSPWTLSIAQKSNTVTAEGRLSRNIINAQIRKDDKDLCTRVYVKGLPKPAGRESDEDAVGYMDADTISTYGIVEKETGGTNLTQAQAERVATAYLNAHKHPKVSVEIEGADLSEITGETLDSFVIGKLFRLTVPEENIVITDYITQISWSDVYNSPYHARIVIGDLQDAAIDFIREQASATKSSKRGGKKQAKQDEVFAKNFVKTDEYGAILEQAGMQLDAHGMIVYARDNVNNIGSIIEMTASELRSEYQAGDAGVYSVIDQTASSIRLEVASTQSDLHSFIEQTPDMIHAEVGSAVSGFAQSVIEQTATYIRTEVSNAASSITQSVIEQTVDYVRTEVTSVASGVAWSVVTQTMTNIEQKIGSKARVYVQMTQPTGTIYEGDIWIKSTGKQTWNSLASGSWNDASNFRWKDYSGVEKYVYQSGSWIPIGDSSIVAEQEVKLEQDKNYIALVGRQVNANKEEFNSRLQVTAREIRSDVSASKSDLYSVIIQTATNVFSGVYDKVGDNFSTIEQTATAIDIGVNSAKSSLYAAINVTSTQIALKVGKDEIISRINLTSESITISSSKVNLEGYVQATDITTNYLDSKISQIATLHGISANFSGNITASGGVSGSQVYADSRNISNPVMNVTLTGPSNNVYTLTATKADGSYNSMSFSRATSLSGAWGGGEFTVSASPQGETYKTKLNSGTLSRSGRSVSIPVRATLQGGSQYYGTGFNATGTITASKSDISAQRGARQSSEPSTDDRVANCSLNGWYVITVSVLGASKTYKFKVDVE